MTHFLLAIKSSQSKQAKLANIPLTEHTSAFLQIDQWTAPGSSNFNAPNFYLIKIFNHDSRLKYLIAVNQ